MGKILKHSGHENEGVLHFEQVIKFAPQDDELAGGALFEIAKIRIQQKDFYEACHNLRRASNYTFKTKKFNQYRVFSEGVTMPRITI